MLEQYERQKQRGREGFGLFDGQEMHLVHTPKEKKIKKWLRKYDSNILLFHHRLPTSTVNVREACHPFATKDYFGNTQYVLIHNGCILNADDLFVDHQALGINYQSLLQDMTFNDSESLLWDFALTMEGRQEQMEVEGDMAFICLKLVDGEPDKLYFGRNYQRPLKLSVGKKKRGIRLSSEGEGEDIWPNYLYTFDYATRKIDKNYMIFPVYVSKFSSKGETGNWHGSGTQSTMPYANHTIEPTENPAYWQALLEEGEEYKAREKALEAGSWATDELKAKFGVNTQKYKVPETEHGIVKPERLIAPFSEEELDKLSRNFKPALSEVQTVCLHYLINAKGVFSKAYKIMEADYMDMELEELTNETLPNLLLLEQALAFLCKDDEYVNEKSVSSIWRALWAQTSLEIKTA